MSDISISSSNTERAVSELINKIQTEIIDAGATSGNAIIGAVEHSAGDFIDSLKEEVAQETVVINLAGDLLIAMANYIQSASTAFANVDTTYNSSKV